LAAFLLDPEHNRSKKAESGNGNGNGEEETGSAIWGAHVDLAGSAHHRKAGGYARCAQGSAGIRD
jgi:hypothetical protein